MVLYTSPFSQPSGVVYVPRLVNLVVLYMSPFSQPSGVV